MDQVVQKMLAHPFLGGKQQPFSPDGIEDLQPSGPLLSFEAMVRQVKRLHIRFHHPTKVRTKQDIVKNWLPRYTGLELDEFKSHILLTNFDNYLEIFCEMTGAVVKRPDRNMRVAIAEDMCMINFGMGSANSATLMDLLSAIDPKAVLFLGKCGGLKRKNNLGDLVLPIAGIRGEGTSNDYFPPEVPALPSFMIHRAVSHVIRDSGLDYWSGTVYTTNRRVWEHDDAFKERLRLMRCMAIDMETATLFMTGFANGIPTGALLLVSDQPMVPEGVKTSASDAQITSKFVQDHVKVGIDSLREIINKGRSVKHLRYE
jgi:AMP nucleosidase